MASPVPNTSHDFAKMEELHVYSGLNWHDCSSSVFSLDMGSHGGSGCDHGHAQVYLHLR